MAPARGSSDNTERLLGQLQASLEMMKAADAADRDEVRERSRKLDLVIAQGAELAAKLSEITRRADEREDKTNQAFAAVTSTHAALTTDLASAKILIEGTTVEQKKVQLLLDTLQREQEKTRSEIGAIKDDVGQVKKDVAAVKADTQGLKGPVGQWVRVRGAVAVGVSILMLIWVIFHRAWEDTLSGLLAHLSWH